MFMVISYDIPDDRRRARLATLLENYGQRVQYSVFECILTGRQLQELRRRMVPLLSLAEDSVRFYFLPKDVVAEIQVLGKGQVTRDAPMLMV
jgi:CRISPR-associated protein Cas2